MSIVSEDIKASSQELVIKMSKSMGNLVNLTKAACTMADLNVEGVTAESTLQPYINKVGKYLVDYHPSSTGHSSEDNSEEQKAYRKKLFMLVQGLVLSVNELNAQNPTLMEQTDSGLVDKAVEQGVNFDYNQADMGAYYDTFDPAVYDEMLVQINFSELAEIVKTASELPELQDKKDTIEVMDIGCGTGRCGEELAKVGFKNIDGVDPSQGLLEASEKKGCYRNLHKMYLGNNEFPKEGMQGKYGLVVSSGVWVQGHIPKEGIEEVIKCMQPGAIWVLGLRSKHLSAEEDTMGYCETFKRLEDCGTLKVIKTYTFMRGNKSSATDKNPLFSEQESTLIVYQNAE